MQATRAQTGHPVLKVVEIKDRLRLNKIGARRDFFLQAEHLEVNRLALRIGRRSQQQPWRNRDLLSGEQLAIITHAVRCGQQVQPIEVEDSHSLWIIPKTLVIASE